MKNLFRDVPVAWLQLGHSRPKLLAAVAGIVFADLLIWMQLGFLASAIDISTYIHRKCGGSWSSLTRKPKASKLRSSSRAGS
jgi:hypothetical protein